MPLNCAPFLFPGDCYFLVAVTLMAGHNPQLVLNTLLTKQPNEHGVYCVRFLQDKCGCAFFFFFLFFVVHLFW